MIGIFKKIDIRKQRRVFTIISSLLLFVFYGVIVVSCSFDGFSKPITQTSISSELGIDYEEKLTKTFESRNTSTLPKISKTNTLLSTSIATCSPINPLGNQTPVSYRFLDFDFSPYMRTIEVTQGPVTVEYSNNTNDCFLYKNVEVTVRLGNDVDVYSYINLDNLVKNDIASSDIIIEFTGQSNVWGLLEPINDAVFFYSEDNNIDFDKCLTHFPIQGMDSNQYWKQGMYFDTKGGAFCVITNEGRVAIIKYIENSEVLNADYSLDISFLVSVYETLLE